MTHEETHPLSDEAGRFDFFPLVCHLRRSLRARGRDPDEAIRYVEERSHAFPGEECGLLASDASGNVMLCISSV